MSIADAIDATGSDILHIQFPTNGYKDIRLLTWLLSTFRKMPKVVTLHEFSALFGPRRLGLIPAGLPQLLKLTRADALIFSNEAERAVTRRWAPWSAKSAYVIPIGSSIEYGGGIVTRRRRLVHFGQAAPGKGIEDFNRVAALIARSSVDLPTCFVGGVPPSSTKYADAILEKLRKNGTDVILNAPVDKVSNELASSEFAYLPFPDGATEKRSSLVAALGHGMIVVTRHSDATPAWLKDCTIGADNADGCLTLVKALLENDKAREALREKAFASSRRFDWSEIARRHAGVYTAVLKRRHNGDHP